MIKLAIALFLCAPALHAQTLVLENGTVIDGLGNRPRPNTTVVVRSGHIADLYAAGTRAAPAGAVVLDLSGKYVIPGLIDAHVHLATDPSNTDPRAAVERRLRQALYGGVTSLRDMAEYPNVHHELELLVRNAGLTPLAALRAGTLAGAKAIGIEKTHGSIEMGKAADLVVLDAADIRHTRSVRHTIRNGSLYTRKGS